MMDPWTDYCLHQKATTTTTTDTTTTTTTDTTTTTAAAAATTTTTTTTAGADTAATTALPIWTPNQNRLTNDYYYYYYYYHPLDYFFLSFMWDKGTVGALSPNADAPPTRKGGFESLLFTPSSPNFPIWAISSGERLKS